VIRPPEPKAQNPPDLMQDSLSEDQLTAVELLKFFRDAKDLEHFTPKLKILSQDDLDKVEFTQDRQSRFDQSIYA
jgi:hypothetical protein